MRERERTDHCCQRSRLCAERACPLGCAMRPLGRASMPSPSAHPVALGLASSQVCWELFFFFFWRKSLAPCPGTGAQLPASPGLSSARSRNHGHHAAVGQFLRSVPAVRVAVTFTSLPFGERLHPAFPRHERESWLATRQGRTRASRRPRPRARRRGGAPARRICYLRKSKEAEKGPSLVRGAPAGPWAAHPRELWLEGAVCCSLRAVRRR